MSLIVDDLQLHNRAGGWHFDLTVGRHALPSTRVTTTQIPFRHGLRGEPAFGNLRRLEIESRVLAIPDPDAHQAFLDDLKRRLDPTRGEPVIVRDTLPNGLERWCFAWSRACDVVRVGGLSASPMHEASIMLEALDPFWYSSNGAATLDSGLLLDNGEHLDQGAEVVIAPTSTSHQLTIDTLGSAEVERIRIRMLGPSAGPPGFEADTPAGPVGFVLAAPLAAGELLELDNAARRALVAGVSVRADMTLQAANRHGEYARLRPGTNTIRILGQPAQARILFTPTHL